MNSPLAMMLCFAAAVAAPYSLIAGLMLLLVGCALEIVPRLG